MCIVPRSPARSASLIRLWLCLLAARCITLHSMKWFVWSLGRLVTLPFQYGAGGTNGDGGATCMVEARREPVERAGE